MSRKGTVQIWNGNLTERDFTRFYSSVSHKFVPSHTYLHHHYYTFTLSPSTEHRSQVDEIWELLIVSAVNCLRSRLAFYCLCFSNLLHYCLQTAQSLLVLNWKFQKNFVYITYIRLWLACKTSDSTCIKAATCLSTAELVFFQFPLMQFLDIRM